MDFVVRDAQPEDAGGILAVVNPIIESCLYTTFDTSFTEAAERRYISQLPDRGIFHVAVRTPDRAIVGFQSMEPFAAYTHAFDHVGVLGTYVDLRCRRQGVARRLFRATFEVAQRKGYEKILTYIRADNPSALATYSNQGFRIVGTALRQAKVRGQYIDVVVVERFL